MNHDGGGMEPSAEADGRVSNPPEQVLDQRHGAGLGSRSSLRHGLQRIVDRLEYFRPRSSVRLPHSATVRFGGGKFATPCDRTRLIW